MRVDPFVDAETQWRPKMARRCPGLRPGLGLVLLCAFSTACASGTLAGGRQTETLTVSDIAGGLDYFEVTNQPAVRETVIPGTPLDVWSTLSSVFETLEIEVTTVDLGSLLIGNSGYRARRIEGRRLSTYLECGTGIGRPNADQYEVTLQLMVQLENGPNGDTIVRTLLDAYAKSRSVSGNSIHCSSRGRLEPRIVELINLELTGA